MFHALDETVEGSNLESNLRFVGPTVVGAFQKIVEEALLQQPAIICVEVRPVLQPV